MVLHTHLSRGLLDGAAMVPSVTSTFGKLRPAAEGYLKHFATVACSTGGVDRGIFLVGILAVLWFVVVALFFVLLP